MNSTSSRSTLGLSEMSSTYRTLTSFAVCFTKFATADLGPATTIVKSALSMLSPTARDSMLAPRRANTPATRLMMPASSATKAESTALVTPCSRGSAA